MIDLVYMQHSGACQIREKAADAPKQHPHTPRHPAIGAMLPFPIIKENACFSAQFPSSCQLIWNYPGNGKLAASAINTTSAVNPAEPSLFHIG
jgi:hypothetical protein